MPPASLASRANRDNSAASALRSRSHPPNFSLFTISKRDPADRIPFIGFVQAELTAGDRRHASRRRPRAAQRPPPTAPPTAHAARRADLITLLTILWAILRCPGVIALRSRDTAEKRGNAGPARRRGTQGARLRSGTCVRRTAYRTMSRQERRRGGKTPPDRHRGGRKGDASTRDASRRRGS